MTAFPIVKHHDEEEYGRYRTTELILDCLNAYAAGDVGAWVQD